MQARLQVDNPKLATCVQEILEARTRQRGRRVAGSSLGGC